MHKKFLKQYYTVFQTDFKVYIGLNVSLQSYRAYFSLTDDSY